jgi:hypothetical protein
MKADSELRDLIFDIFREKGDLTIAGMVRELAARDVKHHRLTVTGYLHAMADAGFLEVRSVPPAKLFTLRSSPRMTLHSVVGEAARRVAPSRSRAVELAVLVLERVLDRPVFLSEVTGAGFTQTGPIRQLGKRERAEAAKRLERSGIEDRAGEPMFMARGGSEEEEVQRLMEEALLIALDAHDLKLKEVKQAKLSLEDFS